MPTKSKSSKKNTKKNLYRITFRAEVFVKAKSPEEAEEIYGGYDLFSEEAKDDLDIDWVETCSVEEQ